MSFKNFIPEVWAAGIETELEKNLVFAEDCNRKYEGEVKKQGDQVRILGVGKPTIKALSRANATADIDAPEEIDDTSVTMVIDQIAYFNFLVGDIDKAQAQEGDSIMAILREEASEGLADVVDQSIAGLILDASVPKYNSSATKVTTANVLTLIDYAVQKLRENNVKETTKKVLNATPRFYSILKAAYQDVDKYTTTETLKNGRVGIYNGVIIKMSNNVATTNSGAEDNIPVRTPRAFAYAQPLTHVEAYRPEKKFADALKGFILYGVKVVRPKEAFNLNVKYTD